MTRVADTSALYALFSEADAHHARAREDVAVADVLVIPTEVLVETVDLLAFRFGRPSALKAFRRMVGLPHVRVGERLSIDGVRHVYESAPERLSLADAFVLATCLHLGAPPLTYDRGILAAARRLGLAEMA